MNKQDLVDAARDHLRLAVAGTLNISVAEYRSSLDAQNAANKCLTNVMSLGYNDELSEALKEILEYRYFGGVPSSAEFDEVVKELRACRSTFQKEIEAYRFVHKNYDKGLSPEYILIQVKTIAPLKKEYN